MRERYHLWLGLQEKRSIKALGLQLWEHIGGERELVKAYAFSGGWEHNGRRRGGLESGFSVRWDHKEAGRALVDAYAYSGGWGHNGGRRGLVDEYESSGGWISTL